MDLTSTYMGLELHCPLVVGASPLSRDVDSIRSLAGAGAGAVVMHSIYEEQITRESEELDYYLEQGTNRFAESLDYFPPMSDLRVGPEDYLDHIADAKRAVDIPIIASLNGVSAGGWTDYARRIAAAGADAIELNIYLIPTNPDVTGDRIEQVYLDALRAVKSVVTIPVAMKLSPFFTATANIAKRLAEAGADSLVLFNRFYQPDLNVRRLEVEPSLSLSTSEDIRLPLRWIAILFGRINISLASTTGVHTGEDAAKMILAGADAVQMVSSLLMHGPGHLITVREEMSELLESIGYASIRQARGVLSQAKCAEPAAFERANYMKIVEGHWQTV